MRLSELERAKIDAMSRPELEQAWVRAIARMRSITNDCLAWAESEMPPTIQPGSLVALARAAEAEWDYIDDRLLELDARQPFAGIGEAIAETPFTEPELEDIGRGFDRLGDPPSFEIAPVPPVLRPRAVVLEVCRTCGLEPSWVVAGGGEIGHACSVHLSTVCLEVLEGALGMSVEVMRVADA